MATYKKHGKKKSRDEKIEEGSTTAKVFEGLDSSASNFEIWVTKNQNVIFTVIGVIVVGVLGYLAYQNFVVQPRQEEAVKEMSQPLDYFNRAMSVDPGEDRNTLFMKSLNGSGGYGLLDIAENYKGTDAANIANYAAGMAYLNLGEYKEAVTYLERFKGKDEIYPAVAKGAMGDAFMENGQPQEALKYYEEAANIRTNSFTTPRYLLKAGMTAVELEQFDKAKVLLNRIEKDYPESDEAERALVFLGIAESSI
ncbi:MAG TPA: tetratricopeptide repeat protein [Flavobacteriaceae bacterium]|nr:tetratricopeptide repeat protein [Flavobacteriaceae bacterium]